MKRWFLRIFMFTLWALLLAGGGVAYEAYRFLTTPASETPEELFFSIAPGSTFDRVAWDLKKAGVITDVFRFRLLAQSKEALGKIKAGEFMVNKAWTPEQVLRQITEGRSVLYRFSVREGLTWWETARAVEEQGFARYEDFKAVIHDPAFLREHDIPFANAEGFLFPETYLLPKPRQPLDREQARIVASAMIRMFWKQTAPLWTTLPPSEDIARETPRQAPQESGTGAAALPAPLSEASAAPPPPPAPVLPPLPLPPLARESALPPVRQPGSLVEGSVVPAGPASFAAESAPGAAQGGETSPGPNAAAAPAEGGAAPGKISPSALRRLIILASLVEKETGVPAERGRVAGVYANRLRLGMLLQCDPTIIYGVGETFSGAIRRSQIDDPKNLYNTYQHPGLPPGPICSSGLSALRAALTPEKHDYLYFVATGLDGGHTFSKTLGEHNKAVQVYRSRMRGR